MAVLKKIIKESDRGWLWLKKRQKLEKKIRLLRSHGRKEEQGQTGRGR